MPKGGPKRAIDARTRVKRRARLEAIQESVYVDPIHASVPIESGSTGLDVRRLTGASGERAEVLAEGVRGTNKQQPWRCGWNRGEHGVNRRVARLTPARAVLTSDT